MTDQEFYAWIRGYCYAKQSEGYGISKPSEDFRPIVVIYKHPDGSYNREYMLSVLPLSDSQKELLLRKEQ